MISALVLAGLLTLSDPSGDTVGDGSLRPPSNEVLRTLSAFDVLELTTQDDPGFGFTLTLGSLSDPFDAPNGFSLPVIELYVATFEQGQNDLLPGSGMRLPEGQTWRYAFRLSGDSVRVFQAREGAEPKDVSEEVGLNLRAEDNRLTVQTRLELPDYSVYGLVGLYDAFADNPWRPLSETPSPWAFSSESQRFPVVDVMAETRTAQQAAIASGILPRIAPSASSAPVNLWLVLMIGGVALSLSGFAIRAFRPKEQLNIPETSPSFVEDDRQETQLTVVSPEPQDAKEPPAFPTSFDADNAEPSDDELGDAGHWRAKPPRSGRADMPEADSPPDSPQ